MTRGAHDSFVLALYPTSRGFAFVLFEGDGSLYDWGMKEVREKHKNARTFEEIRKLIARYRPDALVIESAGIGRYRRASRIQTLYRKLNHLATEESIAVFRYSWSDVFRCLDLSSTATRHEIAQAVAEMIPAFAMHVPEPRKDWTSQSRWQGLFNAGALGLTHYGAQMESESLAAN